MCVSVTASAVLARDYRGFATRGQRGFGMPHVWAQVLEKRAASLSAERLLLEGSSGCKARSSSSRSSWGLTALLIQGGLASTQAGYQQDHHGTTFEQTAALTSRCDIQESSLRRLEWLGFFLKTFCLLSWRLPQFRVWSFKCCLAHFQPPFPGVLISCFWPFLSLIVHLILLQVSWW